MAPLTQSDASLRTGIVAGSPCPIEVMRQVIEKMHMLTTMDADGYFKIVGRMGAARPCVPMAFAPLLG